MKIRCSNCGSDIRVNGLGRKRLPIPFNNISKVLQWHSMGHWQGKPHFLNTAKKIFKLYGIEVAPGFVQLRLQEEARVRGIAYDELLAQLMTDGNE